MGEKKEEKERGINQGEREGRLYGGEERRGGKRYKARRKRR